MTESAVEALLGGPAGDYTTGPILEPSEPDEFGPPGRSGSPTTTLCSCFSTTRGKW